MDHPMTKEESYADRRKLFKNIWENSLNAGERDDILTKPKVIKTLRLDEMDRSVAGKRKKQRIKNLRIVCNRLLDFCDRQDADDLYYKQMVSQGTKSPLTKPKIIIKKRIVRIRKKIKRTESKSSIKNFLASASATSGPSEDVLNASRNTISRNTSPIKIKRKAISFATKSLKPGDPHLPNSKKKVHRKCVKKSKQIFK